MTKKGSSQPTRKGSLLKERIKIEDDTKVQETPKGDLKEKD